jgi:hypothetical protein
MPACTSREEDDGGQGQTVRPEHNFDERSTTVVPCTRSMCCECVYVCMCVYMCKYGWVQVCVYVCGCECECVGENTQQVHSVYSLEVRD